MTRDGRWVDQGTPEIRVSFVSSVGRGVLFKTCHNRRSSFCGVRSFLLRRYRNDDYFPLINSHNRVLVSCSRALRRKRSVVERLCQWTFVPRQPTRFYLYNSISIKSLDRLLMCPCVFVCNLLLLFVVVILLRKHFPQPRVSQSLKTNTELSSTDD